MRTALFTLAGVLLLALVLYDVYATILRATKRPGPISEQLNHGMWWTASAISRRMSRRWRHRVLTAAGPLLLPILISILIVLLIVGFALVYMPRINTSFAVSESARTTPWLQSLYFSGVTLLTIGYGDILPKTSGMRTLALVEGAAGIAVISLSITYLLTVYSALERKRALALSFYHQARQGADVAGFITRRLTRGRLLGLTDTLRTATRDLHELLESHVEHPIIHYFHPLEVYKGLPRALFVILETATIVDSCLDRQEYVEADDHPDVEVAGESARHVLLELVTSLNVQDRATEAFETPDEERARRRRCFRRATRRLREAGVKVREDHEQAYAEYATWRDGWERQLYWFALFLGYDWDEVSGDRELSDATDDEIEERHAQATV